MPQKMVIDLYIDKDGNSRPGTEAEELLLESLESLRDTRVRITIEIIAQEAAA